ncbi:hypothetical protein F4802DRAFT_580659 [Xylaria palmicola]|nr:hypothetical protein F4802DRAFT_580659 [Xylaria palmicola]
MFKHLAQTVHWVPYTTTVSYAAMHRLLTVLSLAKPASAVNLIYCVTKSGGNLLVEPNSPQLWARRHSPRVYTWNMPSPNRLFHLPTSFYTYKPPLFSHPPTYPL